MTGTIDYEAEYNNRARVPEHPQIIARWVEAAAAYREQARAEPDLSYGPAERNRLDLFWPDQDRGGPIAMFIHGGYWQMNDKSLFSHLARGLNTHGVPVAVPSYRLCPDVGVADIIEDLRTCCRWLEKHYSRPILAIGHSAGGHLAAVLLASNWTVTGDRHPHRLVPAAVAISGIYDLAPLITTSINARLGLDEKSAHDVSPIGWPAPAATWITLVVGGEESPEFHRQACALVEVWGGHGVHTDLIVVPGANHFTVIEGLGRPDNTLTDQVVALAHSLE